MDFYDAMKRGTSEEDLVKAFNEALKSAKQKLEDERRTKEEQEKEKAKKVKVCRSLAAKTLTSYLTMLYPETKITKETVEQALSNFEKLSGSMDGFLAQFTSATKNGKTKTDVSFKKLVNEDDAALDKFFNELNWMF